MSAQLADVQGSNDERGVALERAGIRGLRLPLVFTDSDGTSAATVATASAWASVPASQRGAHMSRLAESLGTLREGLSLDGFGKWLERLASTMGAPGVGAELSFTMFWNRSTPQSGRDSWIDYEAQLSGSCAAGGRPKVRVQVVLPATTLCPCSKEISASGAHSQRARLTAKVEMGDLIPAVSGLAALLQECASAPVDAVVKRIDEKSLTETAYANPRFAEDVVREAAARLAAASFAGWEVGVCNMESIHNHDAFAFASSADRDGAPS